jgi:hypothetical protein
MSWVITGTQKFTPNALLDQFAGAAAAYSLRNLVGTSNPSVVRVRRSSDNIEADFTAAQVSDGSLAAWVGAGNNGFVRTWYDQSGNGRDASQTTASAQPSIVTNGAVVLQTNKPTLSFSGSNFFTHGYSITTASTIVAITNLTAKSDSVETVYGATAPNSFVRNAIIGDAYGQLSAGKWGTYMNSWKPSAYSAQGIHRLLVMISDGLTTGTVRNSAYTNGLVETFTDTGRYSGDSAERRTIMADNSTGSNAAQGNLQEIIVWPVDQSANIVSIQSNINTHYAIY